MSNQRVGWKTGLVGVVLMVLFYGCSNVLPQLIGGI